MKTTVYHCAGLNHGILERTNFVFSDYLHSTSERFLFSIDTQFAIWIKFFNESEAFWNRMHHQMQAAAMPRHRVYVAYADTKVIWVVTGTRTKRSTPSRASRVKRVRHSDQAASEQTSKISGHRSGIRSVFELLIYDA